jgi:hypothetical protein
MITTAQPHIARQNGHATGPGHGRPAAPPPPPPEADQVVGDHVVQAVPLTARLVGAASLAVNVPVKPIVTDPPAVMDAL